MKHEMTLKQAYKYWDAMSPPDFKEGDTITIIPERQIIDLSRVVGSSIPMKFSNNNSPWYEGSLRFTDGKQFCRSEGSSLSKCKFDTSANNWVSWGPHIPKYDGKCPIPDGVEYEVLLRSGNVMSYCDASMKLGHDIYDWDRAINPVFAFRITRLKEGWVYPWESNDV